MGVIAHPETAGYRRTYHSIYPITESNYFYRSLLDADLTRSVGRRR